MNVSVACKPGLDTLRVVFSSIMACSMLLTVSAGAGELDVGRQKAKTCAVCHGIDGVSIKPDAPNIAGQTEYYLRTQLTNYRSGRRFHQQMNVVAQTLSDDDIDALVTWYSSIKIKVALPD